MSGLTAINTSYNEGDNTWSGDERISFYANDVSVGRIIYNTMKNWPSNVCQICDDDGITVTNAQALIWAIRIAQHLKNQGLDHKDVIGIVAKNSTYLMPLAVACLMNGTPFHSVNPLQGEEIIKYVFEITKPKVIFCDGQEFEMIKSATQDWHPKIYTLTAAIERIPKIEDLLGATTTEMLYQPEPLRAGPDQTVAILCSSGTTGIPKAICISKSVFTQEFLPVTSDSVFFSASALDWMSGLWSFISSTILGTTRIITSRPFSPQHFVQMFNKYKISGVLLQPRFLSRVVMSSEATADALSSIRLILYGGSSTSPNTLQRAREICKNAELKCLYGMTELGAITLNVSGISDNSAGRVLPGLKIRIVDEDGNFMGHKQVGEIYVYTGQVWNGYYGNPEETRCMQDSQGWFHTGDLGYFDDHNYLYIMGRKKETLKYQGLHYCPPEIENVIAELPQVKEVCVVGIYDEQQGDKAGALIVLRKGCDLSANEVIDHVANRLNAVQMQLHAGVQFIDKLPTNSNGKVLRKAAQEIFISQHRNPK